MSNGSRVEVLTRKDLRDLSVISGGLEVLDWVLYDTVTVLQAAPLTRYRFFQQSTGQAGVSLQKTNMEIPGQLPAGYKMVAQKLVFIPKQKTTCLVVDAKDAYIVTQGYAQFFIGTRPYLQAPTQNLIGGAFQGVAAGPTEFVSIAPRTVVNGELEYSPVVPANYAFYVEVAFDTAPSLTANIDIQCQMVGKLVRPRQG